MLRMTRPAPPANPSSTLAIPLLLPPCPNIVFQKSCVRWLSNVCFCDCHSLPWGISQSIPTNEFWIIASPRGWSGGSYMAQGMSELKNSLRDQGVYLITSFADKCGYWEKRKCWLYTLIMWARHEARLETRLRRSVLIIWCCSLGRRDTVSPRERVLTDYNVFSARKSGNSASFLELSPTIVTLYRKNKSNTT